MSPSEIAEKMEKAMAELEDIENATKAVMDIVDEIYSYMDDYDESS